MDCCPATPDPGHLHIYSVPDAALYQIRRLARFSQEFGCGAPKKRPAGLPMQDQQTVLVLHHRLDPEYGWKCWIPQEHEVQVRHLLQRFHLQNHL